MKKIILLFSFVFILFSCGNNISENNEDINISHNENIKVEETSNENSNLSENDSEDNKLSQLISIINSNEFTPENCLLIIDSQIELINNVSDLPLKYFLDKCNLSFQLSTDQKLSAIANTLDMYPYKDIDRGAYGYDASEAKDKKLPLPYPDSKIDLTIDGKIVGYQGYMSEDILVEMGISEKGSETYKDYFTEDSFTYYLSADRKKFQLMGYIGKSIEDNKLVYNKIFSGVKLGIITDDEDIVIQKKLDVKSIAYEKLMKEGFKINFKDNEFLIGELASYNPLKLVIKLNGIRFKVTNGEIEIIKN